MAFLTTIDLVQNDPLPALTVPLKDSNQAAAGQTLDPDDPATFPAIDLTNGAVRMRVRAVGSTTLIDTLVGTIVAPATNGTVTFIFSSSTLDTTGVLEGEIEITDSASRTQTVVDLIKFKVRAQFG